MTALLDTSTAIWAIESPAELSLRAVEILHDPQTELLLSTVSFWEIAIKVGLGKLDLSLPLNLWFDLAADELNVRIVTVEIPELIVYSALPFHHRDPFDRLLISQAIVHGANVVTPDAEYANYPVAVVW